MLARNPSGASQALKHPLINWTIGTGAIIYKSAAEHLRWERRVVV